MASPEKDSPQDEASSENDSDMEDENIAQVEARITTLQAQVSLSRVVLTISHRHSLRKMCTNTMLT